MSKAEREAILAEKAHVEALLGDQVSLDPLAQRSLASRLATLDQELAALGARTTTMATAELLFSGEPVVGTRGIEANFAAQSIEAFQTLVASIHASGRPGGLAPAGPIPLQHESRLFITDTPRGSFGFRLQQIEDTPGLFDTELKSALQKSIDLVSDSVDEGEELEDQLADTNERVLSNLKQFVETVARAGANVRMIVGVRDLPVENRRLRLAVDRLSRTRFVAREQDLRGVLEGILPEGRRFEFTDAGTGETLRGTMSPDIGHEALREMAASFTQRHCTARLLVKEVSTPGRHPRRHLVLLGLQEDEA